MIDDIAVVLQELKHLRAGVADTSTLSYLEKIDLLSLVVWSYYLTVIPQVAQEFGRSLSGVTLYEEILDAPADKAIIEAARRGKLAVFSEDRKVLMTADKIGLPYYNTLMLVLSLFSRDIIDQARCRELMRRLLQIARYGPAVVNFGEQMYDALQEKRCPIMTPCPCVSGKEFDSCCGIYLSGLASAPTAEALMRSRYTAYTKNRYDYLLDTWHPSTRPTLESLTAPSDHS